MQRTILIAAFTLHAAALFGQTPQSTTTKPAGLGKQAVIAKEDANIRAYIELLRTDVRKSKAEIIGAVMLFDTAQANKFWPIYKEYEVEYSTLGDRILALIHKYLDHFENMTD